MALIDLKTNLKSLKYGSDRIGGGNSGQPYIQTDIGDGIIGNVDDGLIRGGGAGAIKSAAIDTLRIGKFLADTPRGPLFIAKQVGLQLSNPKLESKAPKTGIGLLDRLVTNFNDKVDIGPTRLYNLGINTIAQVPVNAFGIHFNRHGLLPVQDDSTKYLAVVKNNNINTGTNSSKLPQNSTNRLLKYAAKLLPTPPPVNKPLGILGQILSLIPGASLFIKPQQQIIDDYIGGPGSVYGVGRTLIKRYDYTSNGVNKQSPVDRGKLSHNVLGVTSQYNKGNISTIANVVSNALLGIINAPVTINNLINSENSFNQINQTAVNYKNNTPAGANGTVDSPTLRTYTDLRNQINKQSNIKQTIVNGLKVSEKGVFTTKNPNINRGSKSFAYLGTGLLGNNHKTDVFNRTDSDILTIIFRAIDPFNVDNEPERWAFSAYMTGFKDNFDATWNDINYTGRAESFYIYSKFKRNVSFNLSIPCFNKTELFEKYRALGQLASTTAGSYNNNLLGGVLLKVNVGNYLAGEYAILNNISYDIPDESSWDVDEELAMYLKVAISLTIVHKQLPQYQPEANQKKSGFFDYLPNPINTNSLNKAGFLPEANVNKFTRNT